MEARGEAALCGEMRGEAACGLCGGVRTGLPLNPELGLGHDAGWRVFGFFLFLFAEK